jgi:hypothetical protein
MVSLLLGLPVIVRGAVGVAGWGAFAGFFLGLLIYGVGKFITEGRAKST